MGRFRTPTLRNIELTGPYMHDGSRSTLADSIDDYSAAGRQTLSGPFVGDGRANPHKDALITGFTLTQTQKDDLVAFLHSLTDRSFIEDPAFSNPFVQQEAP